ncbi:MAG: ATP phosphoribosyltransferase regulatory subunit [Chloroflexi bacterium]|nr:ATP phosphoribosyltransferase regulatory subunit [Chloroflexota bacterium]
MAGFASLPGFRDFPPEDLAVRAYIMQVWRDVAQRYGFHEYDGPPLEPTELYVAKSGPEIVQQLYTFTDKGRREVALRPEMTPAHGAAPAARRPPPDPLFAGRLRIDHRITANHRLFPHATITGYFGDEM